MLPKIGEKMLMVDGGRRFLGRVTGKTLGRLGQESTFIVVVDAPNGSQLQLEYTESEIGTNIFKVEDIKS